MNQTMEFEVNPLPAKTWNWLHMNETTLNETVMTEQGTAAISKPDSVSLEEKSDLEFPEMKTGMGEQMDAFADAGKIPAQLFVTETGKKEEQPVKLDFSYPDQEQKINRIGIHVLPDSELTVIMDFTSDEQAEGTAAVQTKVWAEDNATLHLVQVQRLGKKFRLLDDFGAVCGKKANIQITQLVLGGKDTYIGNYTALSGDQSNLETDIGYLAGGESRVDMNLVAYHTGKKTNSRMDAAGVLSDKATKIFRGTIDFRKGCAGSVGNEKEDVLLLDETVVNQTIPLILCNEEDVEGNHGATIGKLDEELLFYLESRGIAEEDVYAMMARARINAMCSKISDEETKAKVQEYLEGTTEE